MKRILFIFLTLALFTTIAFSQDLITKRSGEDIAAKILEVTQTEIKYKKFDNLEGPLFSILKSDVLMIRYANGTKDIFEQQSQQEQEQINNFNTQPNNTNERIYTYTLGKPINPIGGRKNAWGSGIASLIIPGLGQFINGDVAGGVLYMGSNIACNLIRMNANNVSTARLGLLGGIVVNVFSVVNAAQVAKRVNIARGYQIADNTYLQIQPTLIQQNDMFPSKDLAYGMNLKISF